jgi:hypothetical protein
MKKGNLLAIKDDDRQLTLALLLLFSTIASIGFADQKAPPRPNIVLILCDDLGYADVGFNAEHFGIKTDVVTPNIDALAKQGTIFSQAYVAHPLPAKR